MTSVLTTGRSWLAKFTSQLNFFRIHVLVFTFVPLFAAVIVWATSTAYSIAFIDCLFLTYSAMTTTGLATVDLSTLSSFQQAVLMFLFVVGSMAFVSIIIIAVRQHFFRQAFRDAIKRRDAQSQRNSKRRRSRSQSRDERDVELQPAKELEDDVLSVHDDNAPASRNDEPQPTADRAFLRTRTIQFDETAEAERSGNDLKRQQSQSIPIPRTYSLTSQQSRTQHSRDTGYGGFPTPLTLLKSAMSKVNKDDNGKSMTRTTTIPKSIETSITDEKRSTVLGRNSAFVGLTREQKEELGGIEYRASKLLLIIVCVYVSCVPLTAFIICVPYMTVGDPFGYVLDNQWQRVPTPWFTLFNIWSSFTNCGLSLSDASMIPFQTAYVLVVFTTILIFAGNTAYPIFLRLIIWTLQQTIPKSSRHQESLQFLLDHPRRCFVYLFPRRQTWYLAFCVFTLTMIDFVAFLVLDIGTEVIDSIPVGTRILAALMQSAAVRVEGFAIVSLSALVPAVQVLYVVMMYIAVLPIALAVRSTNVYEEQSLGIYSEDGRDEPGPEAVTKYIGWHARRQLAFDLWWLALALWLICIIERDNLRDAEKATWFNVFALVFEIVSAYGTVGLSLGSPTANFSLAGNFKVLSKLVMIAVMLRGRHRTLPMAIDRAVMLPNDFTAAEEQAVIERQQRLERQLSASIGGAGEFGGYPAHAGPSGTAKTP